MQEGNTGRVEHCLSRFQPEILHAAPPDAMHVPHSGFRHLLPFTIFCPSLYDVESYTLSPLQEDVLEYAVFQPVTQLFCVIGGAFQQIIEEASERLLTEHQPPVFQRGNLVVRRDSFFQVDFVVVCRLVARRR